MLKHDLAELRPLYADFMHHATSLWHDLADDERGNDPAITHTAAWQVFADFLACLEITPDTLAPGFDPGFFGPSAQLVCLDWQRARTESLTWLKMIIAGQPEAKRQAFLKILAAIMGRKPW